jgi:hypothetical protein
MKTHFWQKVVSFAVILGGTAIARAHCDTLSGPVVGDARVALAKGDVAPALKWVAVEHEPAIRQAFARTLVVRKQSAEAALARGSAAPLTDEIRQRPAVLLDEKLRRVLATRRHEDDSVAAGRDYVAAYVAFVHAAERLFAASDGDDGTPAAAHAH